MARRGNYVIVVPGRRGPSGRTIAAGVLALVTFLVLQLGTPIGFLLSLFAALVVGGLVATGARFGRR
jgi:hypothetical protein